MAFKRLVVGTAGHIDHGKSSLVKALTGVDPDRLKEEKARGITIELGFAPLDLPDGTRLAFVDVPGHERFIRHMVAGATGLDAVLLVIAADEGVMPQTREHLDILELLGVSQGAIVLTKLDLVDEELLELAMEDVRDFVKGTFLEGAPLLPCSSTTRQGLDALLGAIRALVERLPERSLEGPFRLPIDRVFTLRGFGTVVTGTVLSGQAGTGETLELLPSGQKVRVRGLQVHGGETARVLAGQRAAVNLQGIDRDAIDRGEQLASPGQLLASSMLDVSYRHLASGGTPLEHRARVRFLSGTYEVNGVAHVLASSAEAQEATDETPALQGLEPGDAGFLQLRLDAPVATRAGDRFILRLESPMRTLGGGVVIDPTPSKHRRHGRVRAAQRLEHLSTGTVDDAVQSWLELAGPAGVAVDALAKRSALPVKSLKTALDEAVARGGAERLDAEGREYATLAAVEDCQQEILALIERIHGQHPLKAGVTRGELRGGLSFFGERVFLRALERLIQAGEILHDAPLYWRRGFQITLPVADQAQVLRLREILEQAALAPPLQSELREQLRGIEADHLQDLLGYLAWTGSVTRIKEGHWVWSAALDQLREDLITLIRKEGVLTPAGFKELTGLSRKWAIPLLEYFDRIQLTLRVGDNRQLRGEGG